MPIWDSARRIEKEAPGVSSSIGRPREMLTLKRLRLPPEQVGLEVEKKCIADRLPSDDQ
jgi:hypothetical protein